MFAVFHIEQGDGQVIATSQSHPNWAHLSPNFAASHRDAGPALLEHIQRTTTFSHYDVPIANAELRAA